MMVPSRSLILRLAEEINYAGIQRLLPPKYAGIISDALKGKNESIDVQLQIPAKVTVGMQSDLANTSFVRCVKCGKVYDLSSNPKLITSSKCVCGGSLVPAPIWSITSKNIPLLDKKVITTSDRIKISLSLNDYSETQKSKIEKILIKDKSRPISELKFYDKRDKELDPFVSLRRKAFIYYISLMPSESITKPISISAFSYSNKKHSRIRTTMGELNGIREILYVPRLEVIQATVAYRAGHYRTTLKSRVYVFDITESGGLQQIRLFIRYIKTQGLVVKINKEEIDDIISKLKLGERGFWSAVHTLNHAFLVRLPQITGLESRNFGEALSINRAEFAVFDNSFGGLGGIEGVVDLDAGTLNPNYELVIRESHSCPLECMRACKACLYTDSCYMLNWNLNRKVLVELNWGV